MFYQEDPTCVNTPALRQIIPGVRLVPSQAYELQVRSLLDPGEGSRFEGSPSEWTEPEKWTSHPGTGLHEVTIVAVDPCGVIYSISFPSATWSITYVAYFLISVFVAVLFLVFYYAFPACRRYFVYLS